MTWRNTGFATVHLCVTIEKEEKTGENYGRSNG
jgi:hypothetical protein